jgi:hypothetical protein
MNWNGDEPHDVWLLRQQVEACRGHVDTKRRIDFDTFCDNLRGGTRDCE